MRPAKPKAAAPPIILTAFERAPLGFAEALGVELDEEGEDAFDAPEDVDEPEGVDEAGGTEEVRVTPAAAHACWATLSAVARSELEQLASKH